MKTIVKWIFYGNIFYGICTVALAVEANLQQNLPTNNLAFYLFIFCVSVVYYLAAYLFEKPLKQEQNKRLVWYSQNRKPLIGLAILLVVYILVCSFFFVKKYGFQFYQFSLFHWLLLLIFPTFGFLYYGLSNSKWHVFNLRNIGWLKPFIIGFCWAGLTVVFPIFYYHVENNVMYHFSTLTLAIFINNFLYISLLSILFDIKDYANDSNSLIKTFVVKKGLRTTLFSIVIPISVVAIGSFATFGFVHHEKWERLLMNLLPFLALIVVAWSMRKRRSIVYYLIIIDGLMLFKAICGILSILYF